MTDPWVPVDTARLAARRRPFDEAESALVRLALLAGRLDGDTQRRVEQLRYALSFARLTAVTNPDGSVVDLDGPLALHAQGIKDLLAPRIHGVPDLRGALQVAAEAAERTARARASVLERMGVDADALEHEVTTRQLAIASGGGGGAGYVYPGAYDMLDRAGMVPGLMVGTSIGGLMSMFRARRLRFDMAALVAAARALSWTNVFKVLDSSHRYGLPATLRLYLRGALGHLFEIDGRAMRMTETEIPLYIVATGITIDALKDGVNAFEHALDDVAHAPNRMGIRGALKVIEVIQELLKRRDALTEIVLGRTPGTEDFDVLDAAGFSAAIPAVIHYDVLRDDPRMTRMLDALYASHGIARLGEGGMVSNVPARIAWETVASGRIGGHRNVFVLALDCFAPHHSRLVWYPFQKTVQLANVLADQKFADLYVPFVNTPSPLNLVPSLPDAMEAIRWGRETMEPHLPFIREMMRPLRVLEQRAAA